LEKIVFPQLISKKFKNNQHEIRIWSSACAAGQEAYSVAIILKELVANSLINFRIFATDISPEIIQTAENGCFNLNGVSRLSLSRLHKWFKVQNDSYIVSDEIKKHIEFSVFDCLDDKNAYPPTSIFGDFDLVFCANILFYYQSEFRTRIMDKARNCMAKDGLLITGETEREIFNNSDFTEIYPNSAIFRLNKKKSNF
jgi:chemotaxis methyl-accepting protein methylase